MNARPNIVLPCSIALPLVLLGALALSGCPAQGCFRPVRCVAVCGGAVVSSGCGPCGAGTFDNYECRVDAGPGDGGSTDGGSTDAGSTDGASTDAGSTDAGSIDGGSTDTGVATDGGRTA